MRIAACQLDHSPDDSHRGGARPPWAPRSELVCRGHRNGREGRVPDPGARAVAPFGRWGAHVTAVTRRRVSDGFSYHIVAFPYLSSGVGLAGAVTSLLTPLTVPDDGRRRRPETMKSET